MHAVMIGDIIYFTKRGNILHVSTKTETTIHTFSPGFTADTCAIAKDPANYSKIQKNP